MIATFYRRMGSALTGDGLAWGHAAPGMGLPRMAALKPRLSLTLRVTVIYVLFGFAILVGVGMLAYDSGRAALERATITGLSALTVEKEARLQDWFARRQRDIQVLGASPLVVTEIQLLPGARLEDADNGAARGRLTDFLSTVWIRTGRTFLSVFVMDARSGRVLAATTPGDVGKFKEDRAYFIQGKLGAYVQGPYYSLTGGGPSIVFSAPIKAGDGSVLGVIAGRANMDEVQAIIDRRGEASDTDDNFIVNSAGLFVTQPRYIRDQVALRFGSPAPYIERCLAGDSGVALTDDYRPVPVIAVYRWIEARQSCLIAKVDQAEALAPILAFRISLLLSGLVVLVVASVIAAGLARSITRPVRVLRDGAERLGRGERDIILPETSRDELGTLARAFNTMAVSLTENEAELRSRAAQLQDVNTTLARTNTRLETENKERRRAEAEVRTLNDELEQRVASRTAELKIANRELESFAYSVSHDLRAPLRSMDGFSQAMIEDYGDKLEDGAKEFLLRIRANSVRMGQLIDDLLNLSRVSRGGLERQPVRLSDMARDIVAQLREGDPNRQVAVHIAPDMSALADARLMRVVLTNLIGNAWKFTAKTDAATVMVGVTDDSEPISYFVRDNGAGFDMTYAHKLFAPFQRLHRSEEFEGTGIGLATVARIIHRHGGEVKIESAPGEGTTVRFTVETQQEKAR